MEVFDLRSISSVAPMIDLTAGIVAMLLAALAAHLVLLPKLSPRWALAFVAASLLALLAVVATLALYPTKLYFACLIYAVLFVVLGGVVSRGSPNKFQVRRRAAAGSTCMLLTVAFAWWLAFAPR